MRSTILALTAITIACFANDETGRRFCGVDTNVDIEESKRLPSAWPRNNLSWSIVRYPEKNRVENQTMRDLMRRAFDVWCYSANLTVRELPDNDQTADIRVGFRSRDHGDSYPFDGRGTTMAHAFYPGPGIGGDIHFDDDENWSFAYGGHARGNDDDRVSFYPVALHEIGHSLGIVHSQNKRSIMYPYYSNYDGYTRLSNVDEDSITRLYGRRATEDAPPIYLDNYRFDTTAKIRGELLVFRAQHVWRVNHRREILGPFRIDRFFYTRQPMNRVDAVYERSDGRIAIIVDSRYYLFDELTLMPGYPRGIDSRPYDIRYIDAIAALSRNEALLVSGNVIWLLNERTLRAVPLIAKNYTANAKHGNFVEATSIASRRDVTSFALLTAMTMLCSAVTSFVAISL